MPADYFGGTGEEWDVNNGDTATDGSYAPSWKDFTLATTAFTAGSNTIAVEIHQFSATSSDIRLDMTLRGETAAGEGPHPADPLFFAAGSSRHTIV